MQSLPRPLLCALVTILLNHGLPALAEDPAGRLVAERFEAPQLHPEAGSDIPAEVYRQLELRLAEYESSLAVPPEKTGVPTKYRFLPIAGQLERDIFLINFADLDPTRRHQDYACGGFTYDTHQGHDTVIPTFAHQEIGVPAFAALDGTVIETHDGENDRRTSFVPDAAANYVVLDHGNGQIGLYWHFRKGSVMVEAGEKVVAGQQIGEIGSSGFSTWPHLHFETRLNGDWIEPNRGDCNPGASGWTRQPTARGKLALVDFAFSPGPPPSGVELPEPWPRTGHVALEDDLFYWFQVANLPPQTAFRVRFQRPDKSFAFDSGDRPYNNSTFVRWGQSAHQWDIRDMHRIPGTWTVHLSINGKTLIKAKVKVQATRNPRLNRKPKAMKKVTLEPAQPRARDVVVCKAQMPLIDDADYDLLRYTYLWKVDDKRARRVTTAALSDALPRDAAKRGQAITCQVTPSDGRKKGRAKQARVTVR